MKRPLAGSDELLGLPGVGPATAARLAAAGLSRLEQLATYAPRRYDDAGAMRPIAALVAGERAYLEGEVVRASVRRFFSRATLEVMLKDESGTVLLRWFRFRGEVPERFEVGRRVRAAGLVRAGKRGLELAQPIAEAVGTLTDGARLSGPTALRARYASVPGVPGARLEKLCALASDSLLPEPAFVPAELPSLSEAARIVHLHPAPSDASVRQALLAGRAPAQLRMAWEELLLLRLRARVGASGGPRGFALEADAKESLRPIYAALPYAPTAAQAREIAALSRELASTTPMRRLLTGDVGSGKTLCAAAAFELCLASGARGAMLLPTLLLAEQQAAVLGRLLAPSGRRVALLHGGTRRGERKLIEAALADPCGAIDVIVGTHALLDEDLAIARLALVVVDEQQRFGVAARAALVERAARVGETPHQLALSATPIPRTLALALRGALSVGHLDELPPGRQPVATQLFDDASARARALTEARREIDDGGQVFWVCPQIDGGDTRGVIEVADWVSQRLSIEVAICHGRQPGKERQAELGRFRDGAKVLVATTVVEVGLDIPGASLMVIEAPERLGLSALHQLRGRVGRGARQSRCLLVAPGVLDGERSRLRLLVDSTDGLAIAEADLQRRGMGDLGGVAQSGLPSLPPLPPDALLKLVESADEAARQILARDPGLTEVAHARLARNLEATAVRRLT